MVESVRPGEGQCGVQELQRREQLEAGDEHPGADGRAGEHADPRAVAQARPRGATTGVADQQVRPPGRSQVAAHHGGAREAPEPRAGREGPGRRGEPCATVVVGHQPMDGPQPRGQQEELVGAQHERRQRPGEGVAHPGQGGPGDADPQPSGEGVGAQLGHEHGQEHRGRRRPRGGQQRVGPVQRRQDPVVDGREQGRAARDVRLPQLQVAVPGPGPELGRQRQLDGLVALQRVVRRGRVGGTLLVRGEGGDDVGRAHGRASEQCRGDEGDRRQDEQHHRVPRSWPTGTRRRPQPVATVRSHGPTTTLRTGGTLAGPPMGAGLACGAGRGRA